MKLYGWIPHLNPSLELAIPDLNPLIKDQIEIFCDDTGSSGPMHLNIKKPKSFVYGESVIEVHVSYGPIDIAVKVSLSKEGMMSLETPDYEGINPKDLRYILREVYFEFKKTLHRDTHHLPDERNEESLSGPDELLSLNHGDKTEEEAINEILNSLIKSISDMNHDLSDLTSRPIPGEKEMKDCLEFLIHDQYRTASGFVIYAFNYINLFFNNNQTLVNSLESYQSSLDSLYQSHNNEDTHRLNSAFLPDFDTPAR